MGKPRSLQRRTLSRQTGPAHGSRAGAEALHYIKCTNDNSARDLAISQRNTVEG
jgi:hypothetical protein